MATSKLQPYRRTLFWNKWQRWTVKPHQSASPPKINAHQELVDLIRREGLEELLKLAPFEKFPDNPSYFTNDIIYLPNYL